MSFKESEVIELLEIIQDPTHKSFKYALEQLNDFIKTANKNDMQKYFIASRNFKSGDLNLVDNIQCSKCKNKGVIYYLDDLTNEMMVKDCSCMFERNIQRELKKNGLNVDFKNKTFDNFKTNKSYQKRIKEKAIDYVNNHNNIKWFTILGQSGMGKTHISTAISNELIKQGKKFKYMPFAADITTIINGMRNFNPEINKRAEQLLNDYKKIEVLYIDDFLKIKVYDYIFDLIDYRYKNNLITIISSELTLPELYHYDQAIGGRIMEKSENYMITHDLDDKVNYRIWNNQKK